MRHHLLLVLSAGLAGSEPVAAQGFGFLFGEPPPHVRRTPHPNRPRIATPISVPLPVPRPHFPSDETPALAGPSMEAATAPASVDVANPAEAVSTSPPLPPERPADLIPPLSAPIDRSKSDTAKETVAVPTGPAEPSKPEPARLGAATETKSSPPPTIPASNAPLPPDRPAELGPRTIPAVAPSGATTAFDPREPAADAGCAERLKARGVIVEDTTLGPQPDTRCMVVQPMRLFAATLADGSKVSFPDAPTIACTTVDAFSAYVHDLLAPLAKGTWGIGLTSVWTGPGLECRSRDHVFGAKLSAHGQGLAVDVAQLKLADGRLVAVGEPKTDVERGFETAARAGGCGYFHTVLGPGSDSYHRTHWHFDLEVRGKDGDSKYCK